MKKLIFIKLGGSLITEKDKPYTARMDVIQNIATELAHITKEKKDTLFILGNGGGSFPHYPAVKYKMKEGIKTPEQVMGFCEVQDAASRLNRIVVRELLDKGISACSINPSSIFTARKATVKNVFLDSIIGFLNTGVIPVVYGDIIFDEEKGSTIFSTEDIFNILISEFLQRDYQVEKVLYLCTVDGVYDKNGKVIPQITEQNWENVKTHLYATEGFDVTGGMVHKIESALDLAQKGIQTYILKGKEESLHVMIDENQIGTVIR